MLFLSPLFLGFLLWGAWYREDVGGADSLMVFDEYHFLSAVHKRQLFAWIRSSGRLESVRFVLIANRIDGLMLLNLGFSISFLLRLERVSCFCTRL